MRRGMSETSELGITYFDKRRVPEEGKRVIFPLACEYRGQVGDTGWREGYVGRTGKGALQRRVFGVWFQVIQ
jgi:hypothetical protein